MAREYLYVMGDKKKIKNVVINASIRTDEDEKLPEQKWAEIGTTWAEKMGFSFYTIVQHSQSEIHIAAVRVGEDGKTISDSHDYARSERIVRALEIEHKLTRVESSHLLNRDAEKEHKKSQTGKQINMHARTGKVPPSMIVQKALDEALSRCITATDFVDFLESQGIGVRANIASTGRLNGFAYEIDGQLITAKALGKGYTLKNLEQKGLNYEQGRDFERLRATLIGGEVSADVRAELVDRADHQLVDPARRDSGSDRGEHVAPGGELQPHGGRDTGGAEGQGGDRREIGRDRGREQIVEGEARSVSWAHEGPERKDRVARTNGQRVKEPAHDSVRLLSAHAGAGRDIVDQVVGQTLDALPDEAYKIRLLRRDSGEVVTRDWTREQIMDAVPWLRRENAKGKEILFRPTDARYLLLDDVPQESLPEMERQGVAPAVVTETSTNKFQAWIKLPQAVEQRVALEISRGLVERFGADKGAIGTDRFGKLPGFTNRKPEREYERNGKILAPFVRLIAATGAVIERGAELIAYAKRIAHEKLNAEVRDVMLSRVRPKAKAVDAVPADQALAQEVERQRARRQGPVDESVLDYIACARLIAQGYDAEDLQTALADASGRKTDPADYARRTIEKAQESDIARGWQPPETG